MSNMRRDKDTETEFHNLIIPEKITIFLIFDTSKHACISNNHKINIL